MPTLRQKTAIYPPRVFNTKLQELLLKHKLKEYWLAEFLGVTPVTANRIKNGIDLKLSYALKLASYFKVSVEEIWETCR